MIDYLKAAELLKEVGLDNTEFLKRARFLEGVRVSIERREPGFRGGWISSAEINSDLHPRQWAALLEVLGYVLHSSMAGGGRSAAPVSMLSREPRGELRGTPKKAWVRLFVLRGSPGEKINGQAEALRAYKLAQIAR